MEVNTSTFGLVGPIESDRGGMLNLATPGISLEPPLRFGRATEATPSTKQCLRVANDARTGMPPGMPEGAMCVQRFDGSLNSAIHITYRISLRSSSMPEPRDPLLKVLVIV